MCAREEQNIYLDGADDDVVAQAVEDVFALGVTADQRGLAPLRGRQRSQDGLCRRAEAQEIRKT